MDLHRLSAAEATTTKGTLAVLAVQALHPRTHPGNTRRKAVNGPYSRLPGLSRPTWGIMTLDDLGGATALESFLGRCRPFCRGRQPGCEFELPYASGRPMPASRSDCSVGPTPRQHPASSPSMTTAGTTLIPRSRARPETAVSFISKTRPSHESQASRWTSSTNSVHAGHAALNTSTIRLFAIGSSSPFVSYRSTLVGRYAKATPARTCSQRESRAPRSRSRPTSRPLQSSFATSMKNLKSGPYSRVKPYEATC